MHLKSSKSILAAVLAAVLISGCNEHGDTGAPATASPAAGAPASANEPARASVPASAQFAEAKDTAESIKAMTETPTCSLENVVTLADNSTNSGDAPNSYKVQKGKAYKLIGFATNSQAGTVPKAIRLTLVGNKVYALDAVTGSERPDVGTYFKNPALATAGYQADAAFDDVAPGEYSVIAIETDGAAPVACPTHQIINVL